MLSRISILGTGLLGTSVGLALRASGFTGSIVGWNRSPVHAHQALKMGALDSVAADPIEANDLAAKFPERVADLHQRLREFGTWQKTGVAAYAEGRDGFKPPKDWIVLKP